MRAAGRALRLVAVVALGAALAVPEVTGGATAASPHYTLTLSLPDALVGCSVLDPSASPSLRALLDLVRPSAFLTSPTGDLAGSQSAITSAELISLRPQTVVYTLAGGLRWSNGHPWRAQDLVEWWRAARAQASVASDGYRDIVRLHVGADGTQMTAIFAHPYSPWALLFHDVGYRGEPVTCPPRGLAAEPSLGPYRVVAATPERVVLVRNATWPVDHQDPSRIIAVVDAPSPRPTTSTYASYSLTVDRAQVDAISAHAADVNHLGVSSGLEEVLYAPHRPLMRTLPLREALSIGMDRTALLTALWGAAAFSPSVAASAIFSQSDPNYPGVVGQVPTTSSTTSTVPPVTLTTTPGEPVPLTDCVACARAVLRAAGYHRSRAGLVSPQGVAVHLVVAYGPTDLDRTTATLLAAQWAALGVTTSLEATRSERQAVSEIATARADVAVVDRQTGLSPATMVRAFVGPAYPDAYATGIVVAGVPALYHRALDTFNAVTARSVWAQIDHLVMESFWVRPLFTPPSLETWSMDLGGVVPSDTLTEFIDQIPSWWYAAPVPPTTTVGGSARGRRVH
ncbi:MAG: ABC transporter substrate-binding protein [Acidimicrobiales bacterium]